MAHLHEWHSTLLHPPWRGALKALLTQGNYDLSLVDGKTKAERDKTQHFKNWHVNFHVCFCMSKRKPVWTEPWLSWTLWLSWSAKYCLLSTEAQSVSDSAFEMSTWETLVSYTLHLLIQKVTTITVSLSKLQWSFFFLNNTSDFTYHSFYIHMEVSLEFYLLFPDICMRELIWVDREDEETMSFLYVMKNCKFFFWIWVLGLFWQHYTHPLSCWVLCCLQWQHKMLGPNCLVSVRQCVHRAVVCFYPGSQTQRSSWLNQAETKQTACSRSRFSQGCFAASQCRGI